jgi:hypothetical protein
MTLNAYAAEARLKLLDDLRAGLPPSQGNFDPKVLAEGKVKGEPQLGTTRYEPHAIIVEFIYPDPSTTATVLSVRLESPERIVFLPVPSWVVETIWQGDIDGTYHFESEARRLLAEFENELEPDRNERWFAPRVAKRRE